MEEYKIYGEGNYIIIQSISSGEMFHGTKKKTEVDPNNRGNYVYRFFNVRDWSEKRSLKLSQIKKKDGSAYTLEEWKSFYTQNTGNYGGGSSTSSDTLLTEIRDAILANSLIEFDVTMPIPANSDVIYDITPVGSEIRDYQIFDLSNPSQDISGQVSGVVSNLHQLRLHTTIAIPQLQIKGTRTKV